MAASAIGQCQTQFTFTLQKLGGQVVQGRTIDRSPGHYDMRHRSAFLSGRMPPSCWLAQMRLAVCQGERLRMSKHEVPHAVRGSNRRISTGNARTRRWCGVRQTDLRQRERERSLPALLVCGSVRSTDGMAAIDETRNARRPMFRMLCRPHQMLDTLAAQRAFEFHPSAEAYRQNAHPARIPEDQIG